MPVKFNEYWNIIPGTVKEYAEFMKRSRIPSLNKLGINVNAIWCGLIGPTPQIISEGIANNTHQIEIALTSKEYMKTHTKLLNYVKDYQSKVLVPTGRFEHLPRVADKSTIKFNQYWEVISGKEDEYARFIRNDFSTTLKNLGIRVGGEWQILIGGSPNIIFEGRCETERLMKALNSVEFRKIRLELLQLVSNYTSRILVIHAFKSISSRTVDYEFVDACMF